MNTSKLGDRRLRINSSPNRATSLLGNLFWPSALLGLFTHWVYPPYWNRLTSGTILDGFIKGKQLDVIGLQTRPHI